MHKMWINYWVCLKEMGMSYSKEMRRRGMFRDLVLYVTFILVGCVFILHFLWSNSCPPPVEMTQEEAEQIERELSDGG